MKCFAKMKSEKFQTSKLCNLIGLRGDREIDSKAPRRPWRNFYSNLYAAYICLPGFKFFICWPSPKLERPTHQPRPKIDSTERFGWGGEVESHKFLYNFLPNAIERHKFHRLVTLIHGWRKWSIKTAACMRHRVCSTPRHRHTRNKRRG